MYARKRGRYPTCLAGVLPMDSEVLAEAVVCKTITPLTIGSVKACGGVLWRARTEEDSVYPPGSVVQIRGRQGNVLVVSGSAYWTDTSFKNLVD